MKVFFNGQIIEDEGFFNSKSFRFGNGFFETIYYNGEKLCHLDKHLERLTGSLDEFEIDYEKFDIEDAALQVIEAEGSTGKKAKLNIFAPDGGGRAEFVIMAGEYSEPKESGYILNLYTKYHMSFLNQHKSMNYMHFINAYESARKGGYDNATLLTPENEVLEAATANLVFKNDEGFFTTRSDFRLEGTALKVFKENYEVKEKDLFIKDFMSFDHCYIMNSLIGCRSVDKITVFSFQRDEETCEKMSSAILG